MVARINKGQSISRSLNYNEQKLNQGKAICLHAENYLEEAGKMNFYEKLSGLTSYAELNQRVKANSVHISLNFDNKDSLNDEKLQAIASDYMQQIGFENQPYLIYKHNDAGHPHLHIVSTNIRFDGSRIDMHNIGKNQSEAARKSLELKYNLVQANAQKINEAFELKPIKVANINYGKSETKRAISNVLDYVLRDYKFGSLPEFNAVLRTFNVAADICEDGSQTKKHNGLYYRILDEKGNKVGVPLKASLFYMQPTLARLQKHFDAGKTKKQTHKTSLKATIDSIMSKKSLTLQHLITQLKARNVDTILRQNDQKMIYGITFVDHKTKCVFNGSDLGKEYSAAALQRLCNGEETKRSMIQKQDTKEPDKTQKLVRKESLEEKGLKPEHRKEELLNQLIKPEETFEQTPYALKKRKKKSKKQSH